MASSTFIENELDRLAQAFAKFCRVYLLPFESTQPVSNSTIRLLHIHPSFYRGAPNPPANPPARPAAYRPCSVPTVRDGSWVGLNGPQTSTWIPAADRELFGAFVVGGLHGDELAAPEIVIEVCELLLDALKALDAGNVPGLFGHSSYSLSGQELQHIVERIEFFVVPLACPYSRDKGRRLNYNDVNLNRNFPFLWDMHYAANTYYGTLAPRVRLVDPSGSADAGGSAMSEEETQCIVQLHMALEINLYLDCHTDQPESARYPWGCEGTAANSANVWALPPARRADGGTAAYATAVVTPPGVPSTYDEFMPGNALVALQAGATAVSTATRLAGKQWTTGHGLLEEPNAVPGGIPAITGVSAYIGSSDDFAFSLDICGMRVYTLETAADDVRSADDNGGAVRNAAGRRRYYVAMLALFNWYATEVRAGRVPRTISRSFYHRNDAALWAAYFAELRCLTTPPPVPPSTPPVPPAPPPAPPAPPSGPLFFLRNAIRTFFTWLVRLLLLRPRPAPGGPPVHALRLSTYVASSGQIVRGTLLDRSLDFTTVNRTMFSMFLHLPPQPGTTGVVYHRIPSFRLLASQELEFNVPPVGTTPGLMVPPGSYIVLCRYGFWTVESDQLLTLR
jgi:hypothetical protein